MGLADVLQKKSEITKVHYRQIRRNPLNKYKIENIEELAYLIEKYGQMDNVLVYPQDLGDGAKYTIIGGERRWNAIRFNAENGVGDGMVKVEILSVPEDEWQEKRLIRTENTYREKDPETREIEIKECEKEYEYLVSINQKPKGLKRDWIGLQIGLSGKQVDRYMKGEVKALESEEQVANSSHEKLQKPKSKKDIVKSLAAAEKNLEKALSIAEEIEENEKFYEVSDVLNKVRTIYYTYKEELKNE